METEDRELTLKRVEVAIEQINRKYKQKGLVVRLGNDNAQSIPAISTGALILDRAIGVGGLPQGRITEIYGPESSGKSTIALSVAAEAQKLGKTVLYVDAEQALDPIYMRKLGVNLDDLYLCQPDYGEQGLDIAEELIKTQAIDVVIIDSVAALTPKAELEGDMSSQQMGAQARMMSKAMRKLVPLLNNEDNKTLVLFINQIREKIGIMFGNPETTPGGRALKYNASVRIDLRKIEDLKDDQGDVRGSKVRAKIVKNKVGPPLRSVEFDIIYGQGVDSVGCLVDMLFNAGIWTKSGAWYVDENGESFGQGRPKTIAKLAEMPDYIKELESLLNEKL